MQDTESEDQLSSYTNVWGIGVVMFELMTFHDYPEYIEDPENQINGMIKEIRTDKQPEYSETLRELITECVRPRPMERIELDRLRERIKSYRDRMHTEYNETDDDGRAEFESENLLYYIGNEINNMPTTGELNPTQPPIASQFPDPDYPIFRPRFPDEEDIEEGPEGANDFWDEVEDRPDAVRDFKEELDDGPAPEKDLRIYNRKRPDSKSPSPFLRDALLFISSRNQLTPPQTPSAIATVISSATHPSTPPTMPTTSGALVSFANAPSSNPPMLLLVMMRGARTMSLCLWIWSLRMSISYRRIRAYRLLSLRLWFNRRHHHLLLHLLLSYKHKHQHQHQRHITNRYPAPSEAVGSLGFIRIS